jgi:hypothetical protein
MAQPQLSVRSARARDLAHELARREGRTVAQIVERALEAYGAREGAPRESAAEFYRRLTEGREEDIDLDALLQEHRKPHLGIDL